MNFFKFLISMVDPRLDNILMKRRPDWVNLPTGTSRKTVAQDQRRAKKHGQA